MYIYNTGWVIGEEVTKKEPKSTTTTKEIDLQDILDFYIDSYMDKLNNVLNKFGIILTKDRNSLSNGKGYYLVIKSEKELEIGRGLNSLGIGFKNDNKVILITFEPIKLIYNSYVKELNQVLIKAIPTEYTYLFITMVNKLNPITDSDLINDLEKTSVLTRNTDRLKDTRVAIETLIKLINTDKDIRNKKIITKALEKASLVYTKMNRDYKSIRDTILTLDIHSGNWKISITDKGEELILIDPFVVYYGDIVKDADFINKVSREFIKRNN